MIRFACAAARRSSGRTAVLATGIGAVVAAVTILGGIASTGQANLRGRLEAAFRPAYDLLVRPSADVTAFERRHGLVRDNFLSDLFGGISDRQLAEIEAIPGIRAAPVENVGDVLVADTIFLPFTPPADGRANQLFRLSASFDLPGGSQSWGEAYVYVARQARFGGSGPLSVTERFGSKERVTVCGPQSTPRDAVELDASPYGEGRLDGYVACFSERTPRTGSFPSGRIEVPITIDFPMLLTAIDPRTEASFFGLRSAITWGRYLTSADTGHPRDSATLGRVESIPVIASSTSDLDESLSIDESLVAASNGAQVADEIASSGATRKVATLRPRQTRHFTDPLATLYRGLLHSAERGGVSSGFLVAEYWQATQPTYRSTGRDSVAVTPRENPVTTWRAPEGYGDTVGLTPSGANISYLAAPPGNDGTGYSRLTVHDLRTEAGRGTGRAQLPAVLDVVGTFSPSRLPGYSPDSRVPLETFTPPVATAADAATARQIGGRVLGPTTNLAGYVVEPPSLLTSLSGARALLADHRFAGEDAGRPISAVLVRLEGRLGISGGSRRRVEAAAAAIRAATGLSVDVMDGSSPTGVRVDLEQVAGGHAPRDEAASRGASGLQLEEHWVDRGVTYTIAAATDTTTVGLIAAGILTGVLFVAASALALVRRRRRHLAVLAMLGWTRTQVATSLLVEVGVVATAGSLIGCACAAIAAALGAVHVSLGALVAGVVLAPLAACVAALGPVLLGARDQLSHSVLESGRRRGYRSRSSLLGLALALCGASRWRGLVAAGGLAVALSAFATLVALGEALSRRLVDTRTILGTAVDVQVRGLDAPVATIFLVIGAAGVSNAIITSAGERRSLQGVLATIGWRSRDLAVVTAVECLLITGSGVAAGVVLALGMSDVLGVVPTTLAVPLAVTALASTLLVGLTAAVPAFAARGRAPADLVAERE